MRSQQLFQSTTDRIFQLKSADRAARLQDSCNITLEDHRYCRTQIDLTIDRKFALMTFDDRFDDRQSQPQTTANIRITRHTPIAHFR